jgi:circadian clock protein KaiC
MKKNEFAPARHSANPVTSLPKVLIRQLPTGVRGMDEILGGGLPEFSFNIVAGTPGCGKTTLAHQFIFANATRQRPALYFTVLGEPAVKMLRYQQQYTFFDATKLGHSIRFVNLSDVVVESDLSAILTRIAQEVETTQPGVVVVDSFRTILRKKPAAGNGDLEMQAFIQNLALLLTTFQATTFMIGEYSESEIRENPVFTVADGIIWLSQLTERNSVVRKMQIVKLRGQATVPGLHTIRIGNYGLQAFSRTLGLGDRKRVANRKGRLSIGVDGLDQLMKGGIPAGDSVLLAGPSGTGKSVLATHFIAAGLKLGEPGIIAIFEERPPEYIRRAAGLGIDLRTAQAEGLLELLYLRPLDLSVDEAMQAILDAVQRIGAKRLVVDSLVGFEMALAPGFRIDFRESLYRMIAALTGAGVTVVSTVEIEDTFTAFQFSHYAISFLTDDIVRLRYVEIDGQLRKVLVVVKMRGSNHSKDLREYMISRRGFVVCPPDSTDYSALTSGLPRRTGERQNAPPEPKSAQRGMPPSDRK